MIKQIDFLKRCIALNLQSGGLLDLLDRIEELERERDAFYMGYRMKCDEEAKDSALVIIERDQLREQVKILRCERDAARYKQERTVRILTGIHALLYPPRFTDSEGRMWQFKSPIVEEQMQKLSDKIRTIPDEIEALAATEPK